MTLTALHRWPAAALALVLPPRCPSCGVIVDGDDRLCTACWRELRFITRPCCAACGIPFAHDAGEDALCGACLGDRPLFSAARAAVAYDAVARRMLMRLKHGGRTHVARLMGQQIRRLEPDWLRDHGSLIVPVPLARWRLWARGYNQALLIARSLAAGSQVPVRPDLLHRVRETARSGGLSRKDRARNVKGAFRVPARHRASVKGRTVLLVDDVYTSGATANACAAALLKAGAREVRLLSWARVVMDG